jgi:hypothetical protein
LFEKKIVILPTKDTYSPINNNRANLFFFTFLHNIIVAATIHVHVKIDKRSITRNMFVCILKWYNIIDNIPLNTNDRVYITNEN